ncbi:MAG: Rrf2 family transcriptional regulator [Tepidisphaeraceae bacterium]
MSTSKILDIEVVRLAMDLICDAIAAGAYSGTEWLQFRTRLADSPSFRDAAKYVTDYAPPGRSLYITETTSLSSRLSLFAQQIEKFAASPDFHRPEPMPASRAPESLQESPLATPDHHEEILQAMLELEAFNQGSRKSTRDIAERALGKNVDPAILKEPMSALVKQRLIQTKRGRTGGAWLTIAGRTKAEEISKR